MRAVEASLAGIERDPEYYQIVFDTARRALLRRFSYALIYSIEPGAIVVLACLHTRQSPERWRRRVE